MLTRALQSYQLKKLTYEFTVIYNGRYLNLQALFINAIQFDSILFFTRTTRFNTIHKKQ